MKYDFVDSIAKIDESNWRSLARSNSPFVNYNFFKAMENSQSVSHIKGWQPHHLLCTKSDEIQAIMPMYIKQHSWGEYVFDWAWADAYQKHNVPYYPKLVEKTPFTPISTICFHIALKQKYEGTKKHLLRCFLYELHLFKHDVFHIITEEGSRII